MALLWFPCHSMAFLLVSVYRVQTVDNAGPLNKVSKEVASKIAKNVVVDNASAVWRPILEEAVSEWAVSSHNTGYAVPHYYKKAGKDNHAMCPVYGCLKIFKKPRSTPSATIPISFNRLLFISILQKCTQYLKFVALGRFSTWRMGHLHAYASCCNSLGSIWRQN